MLLLLNGLLFVLNWGCKDMLSVWGAKVNASVAAGQWWRLLTCHFLHNSAFHLLVRAAQGPLGGWLRTCSCKPAGTQLPW